MENLSIIVPSAISVVGAIVTGFLAFRVASKKADNEGKNVGLKEMQAMMDANADLRKELRDQHKVDLGRISELENKGDALKKELDVLFKKFRECTEQHEIGAIKCRDLESKNTATSSAHANLKAEFEEHKLHCEIFKKINTTKPEAR